MAISEKQKGVLKGMILGALSAIAIVAAGMFLDVLDMNGSSGPAERLALAFKCLLIPAFFLIVSVGRLAKHRFFTPADIDGGGLSKGTERAMVLQSLLQNTLEQFCIAWAVYSAWSVIMPARTLSVILFAAIAFGVGRVLFFAGYRKGAPARALGFTLTFYPAVLMLLCMIFYMLWIAIV
jgi:uncharacterized membrane protein YecN with MAPEG domain